MPSFLKLAVAGSQCIFQEHGGGGERVSSISGGRPMKWSTPWGGGGRVPLSSFLPGWQVFLHSFLLNASKKGGMGDAL